MLVTVRESAECQSKRGVRAGRAAGCMLPVARCGLHPACCVSWESGQGRRASRAGVVLVDQVGAAVECLSCEVELSAQRRQCAAASACARTAGAHEARVGSDLTFIGYHGTGRWSISWSSAQFMRSSCSSACHQMSERRRPPSSPGARPHGACVTEHCARTSTDGSCGEPSKSI